MYKFQLTRSRGAWHYYMRTMLILSYFNSHAHVERDNTIGISVKDIKISTHTLTWSVTSPRPERSLNRPHFNSHAHVERDQGGACCFCNEDISTHTLTWSVTKTGTRTLSAKPFQLTRSRGAWLFFYNINNLCWEFQLTRSRGAWQHHH